MIPAASDAAMPSRTSTAITSLRFAVQMIGPLAINAVTVSPPRSPNR